MREDGELDELNGEQRNDTEKTIRSLVGTSEDFLLTSLSAQGEVNQFISQGSTKRRAILSRFLDLDIFDKMHELANKEASGLKYQLKNYPDKDWNGSIELVENELNVSLKKLEETQIDLDDQRNQLTSIQNELLSLNVTPVSLEQLKSQEKKVENLVDSCRLCSEKISLLEKEVEDFINKIASIREVKSDYDIDDLRSKKSSYDAIESTLVLLRHSFEKEENILKQHQKSLKILEGIPCNDEFPTCKFIKDANVSKEKFPSQLKIVEDAKSKIDTAVKMIDDIKGSGSIDKLNKLEKLIDLEKKLELEMSRKETEVARLKSSCELQCADLSREKDVLRKMKEAIENEENIAVINLRSKLEKLSTGIRDLETGKLKLATQCGKLTSDKEKLEEERARRNEILENLKVHDIISSAFSKKGIPLAVTKSQLPVINAEISRILHGIVDFSIELENDEDTDSTEIYINYGDSKRIIELCSGMEKTISSLAIRVAMINVSTLPRSDIFIIDEGFGTLDDSAVESCSRFLSSLKRYFKSIIVITHVDGIKDSADHIIEITKFEKDAKVIFGGN